VHLNRSDEIEGKHQCSFTTTYAELLLYFVGASLRKMLPTDWS
jgi:hypothetical protein